MAITRIKTNQITDANITTAKIADAAITAGKLAANITYGSDFAVTGNLTVSGTTTTVSTANTRIEDAILALAAEATGSATADAGILINRGNDDNQALLWDESADQFVLANVGSDIGDTSGNVGIDSYAGLQAGAIVYGSLNDGTTTVSSTAAELNLVDGSTAGTIVNSKAVIYGSGGEVNATKLQVGGTDITSTPAEINLLDTAAAGTIVNSIAVIYGSGGEVNATKLQVGGTDITATPAEINVLDAVTAGTVTGSLAVVVDANKDISSFRNLTATGAITGGSFVIGSADISEADLEQIDGLTAGTVAASKAVVVDANKDIGDFRNVVAAGDVEGATLTATGLTSNQIVNNTSGELDGSAELTFDGTTFTVGGSDSTIFSATVAGVVVASGAMTVDGLASLDGGINVNDDFTVDGDGHTSAVNLDTSGIVNLNNVTEATSATTGALIVDGGVGIAKDLWVGIDLDVIGATTLNGAVTLGDAAGDAIAITGTATFTPSADFDGGFTVAGSQTINVGANRLQGVADPSGAQDAATKAYVDAQVAADGAVTDGTTSVAYGSGDTTTFTATSGETTVAVSGSSGSPVITIGLPDDVTIAGNLTVSGTTTTVNSTVTTIADPILTLGSSDADDNKDRGIEFKYNNSGAKTGFFGYDDSVSAFTFIADATNSSEVFSGTAAAINAGVITATGLTVGNASIVEVDLEQIEDITAGTAAASKAVVLDSSRNIGTIGSITLDGSLIIGSASMSEADLELIDGLTAGTVAASKAVTVDSNKDVSSFRNLTATGAITGGSFVIGSADISEAELETIDGVTAGTVAASKAVVVDANKDVTGFRDVTATGAITGGSFVIGSADISEAELETIDGVTAGTVAASKAVVVDVNKDVTGFRNVTATGSFIIGSADMDETDLEKLDGITNGAGAANKALVLDANADVASGLRNVVASGDLEGATVTSTGLTSNQLVNNTSGELTGSADLTFDGTTFTVGGADATVFSATVAGVVNIDGAATVDGLASLDGGINTNDDFTVDTDGNIVNVAITSSGLASLDGGIDVATAKFTVSTAGRVATVEDIAIAADNKTLEIGAGGDFTIGHDGTNTSITNGTGILAIDGAASSAIRVNEAGADVDFVVEGDTNTALFVVDAGSDTVAVGGAASGDSAFQVNSTGAMLIPHGDTTARNALTGETGMFRFNTAINDLEFYNNSGWTTVSVDYTVATSQTFSGDDSTVAFTLATLSGSDSYTTAGVLVMLNGVVQQPTEVYGVSGTTLTFTTAPATGDLIEVRKFTTASTITGLSDADGDTKIQVEESSDEDIIRFDIAGSQIARIESTGIILDAGKTFQGTATSAQYADLAEMYASDEEVEVGTVVHFVGEGKVGACDMDACRSVAGVVSTDPAYLMNSAQDGVALALAGRVPTKVTGPVAAGDLMVSAGNGMARAEANPALGTVIGKAIEANEGGDGVIEVLVMMM